MGFFDTQNPGIGGLDELTDAEALFVQNLNSLPYQNGDILYYNNGLTRLPKGTDGQLLSLTSGLPSWVTSSVLTNPMTTGGDIIYGGVSGTPTRLSNGTAGQVLTSQGTTLAPIWSNAGAGDMVLSSAQTNSGVKTFLNATLGLRNVANTITSFFNNTATVARTWTLKDADGTIAFTSDITGTNSGTNTGDVTLAGTPNYITIVGQAITRVLINLASHVTGILPIANGGTNQTAFTAKSGNIAGLVFFDGTSLSNDTVVTHCGYDTVADTLYSGAINISNATTQTAKFTNTATSGSTAGAGMQGYSDDGAAMASGDRLGFYALGGATDATHTTSNASAITAFATEAWSGTVNGSNLVFETTANGGQVRSTALTLGQDKSATFAGTAILGTNSITMTGSIGTTGARVTKLWATDIESTNAPTVGGVVVPTISSTSTLTNKTLTTPNIASIKGTLTTDTDGATITFDKNVSDFHQVTLGGNRTLALSNMTAGDRIVLRLTQDATGTRTVTWFTTIKWAGGTAPTLTTTASKADMFGFLCTGAGTYDGFVIGQNI